MARKTFISYKYSEATDLRDRIIKALGEDARYYNGETKDSPDRSEQAEGTIEKALTDMMFNTSVTIVIISPHMKESKWIDWEIEYCLKNISRKGRKSHKNGVVGVIQKINNGYDWFKKQTLEADGCTVSHYVETYLYDVIKDLRYNQEPKVYSCDKCKCVNYLKGSYMAFVEEEDFLADPNKYIENAYEKSENDGSGYVDKLKNFHYFDE